MRSFCDAEIRKALSLEAVETEGAHAYRMGRAQRRILGPPYSVIGTTDGGARPDKGDRTDYSTGLLSYWVREKQIMSLEEAVYRMTGKTALMHDLHDRGFIAPHKAADIVIFDPDTIASKPREPVYDFPGGEMHVKQGARPQRHHAPHPEATVQARTAS